MIIKRFAFWNPGTWQIPKLYWDAFSDEQRIHAICKQLGKVIAYADYLGINVDDIAERLKAIEEGQITPIIVAAVEEWFEEHQEQIFGAITDLQDALPISEFGSENTVKDALDAISANFPVGTENIQDDAITNDKIEDGTITNEKLKDYFTQPNFNVVDRFIYGSMTNADNVSGAQAGCVFTQGGLDYWAQILPSSDTGAARDHLQIRDIATHTLVGEVVSQFGHGYTISYNPTTKQLLTQDVDSTPKRIILINVSNPASPYIEQTLNVPTGIAIDNPCWYDSDHFIGAGVGAWNVYDMNFTLTDSYTVNLHGYSNHNGYVFQSISWNPEVGKCYYGVTAPDGIIICDINEDEKQIEMTDFIACQPYYSYIYMRELEFAHRNGNKMYINQFDDVDGLLVVALLEWDMVNGTIPNENSQAVQVTGNIPFIVNYDTGSLMPHASSGSVVYKLAGDAITAFRSMASGDSRAYVRFDSDYPLVFRAKSTKIAIETGSAVTIYGMNFVNCDVYWSASNQITVRPTINLSGSNYCGVYFRICNVLVNSSVGNLALMENPESVASPYGVYFEQTKFTSIHYHCTFTANDWMRWSEIAVVSAADTASATVYQCIVQTRA